MSDKNKLYLLSFIGVTTAMGTIKLVAMALNKTIATLLGV